MTSSDDADDVDERYKDLVATCWTIFANEHAAAARISMLFEAHPDFALRKLRERPEFFGPLRDGSLLEPGADHSREGPGFYRGCRGSGRH